MARALSVLLRIWKKPWFLVSAGAVVLVGVWIWSASRPAAPAYAVVERGTVKETVSVTGQVEPVEDVSLAFESGGKVSRVYAQVGDKVVAGAALAALNAEDLSAQLASAQASADEAAAKLTGLQNGPRPEEVAVKQTAVDQAKLTLVNAYGGVYNTLESAYVDADDAVRKQSDPFFTQSEEPNPALAFQTTDFQAEVDSENGRAASGASLDAWKTALNSLGPATAPAILDASLKDAEERLLAIQTFLKDLGDALTSQANLSASALTAYQTELTTARTDITTALTSITSAEQDIATDKLAVTEAQNNLALTEAGSAPEDIQAQAAAVEAAQANVQNIRAELDKTVLRAPMTGVVTEEDAKVGQIATAGEVVVKLISAGKYQVTAQVAETDISRVAVGKPVSLTFDALPGANFTGQVVSIDPAETVIDGVATYKTTVAIDSDPRIKPGLTANLDILVDRHDNILYLPQRAVTTVSGKKYVMVILPRGGQTQQEVQTGLRGSEGQIEITSGLNEGDKVLGSGLGY